MEVFKKKLGCCGILMMLMLLGAAAMVGMAAYGSQHVLGQIDRVEGTEATLGQNSADEVQNATDDPDEMPDDLPEVEGDLDIQAPGGSLIPNPSHIINILLIGQDRRPGEIRTRSDSMILCTIDTSEKTLVLTSFLRDLYVDIPAWQGETYKDNRLNVCYALGGMGMLDAALKENFGVQVDHNLEVDFDGFKDVIEVFGGVSINLTAAEAKYLGGGLKEGTNHLTPSQTLAYARIRKIDSDFGRASRQRKVLMTLLADMSRLSNDQLTELFNRLLPLMTTDMTDGDITDYMVRILPILPELEVTSQTIPVSGSYKSVSVRGMAVLVPDLEANREVLRNTLQ